MNRLTNSLAAVLAAVLVTSSVHGRGLPADKRAAMIVTRASLMENQKGVMVGKVFDSVVFSHSELADKEGILTLQNDTNATGSSIATAITIEDEDNDLYSHKVEDAAFVAKLREVVGAEALPVGFRLYDSVGEMTAFTSAKPVLSWFLLEKLKNAGGDKKDLPKGSIETDIEAAIPKKKDGGVATPLKPVETSFLVQLGTSEEITKLGESYQDKAKGPAAIFAKHFASVPMKLTMKLGRTGNAVTEEQELFELNTGVDLRYHVRDQSGAVIIPDATAKPVAVPVCGVAWTEEKWGTSYTFRMSAAEFVKQVAARVEQTPNLVCKAAAESRQFRTACKKMENDPCGPWVIEGHFAMVKSGGSADFDSAYGKSKEKTAKAFQLSRKTIPIILELAGTADRTYEYRAELVVAP